MGTSGVNVNFALALGDLSYGQTGASNWCGAFRQQISNQAVEVITGNHDSGETAGDNLNFFDSPSPLSTVAQHSCPFTLPGATPITGLEGIEYYFDYPASNPQMRFIYVSAAIIWSTPVVNNSQTNPIRLPTGCSKGPGCYDIWQGLQWNYANDSSNTNQDLDHYTWTKNAIDNARAGGIPWVFLMLHKNCLTDGSVHTNCESGSDIMNLAVQKKVDLFITGHEHNYERSVQLATNASCPSITSSFVQACVASSDPSLYTKGAGTIILTIGTGGEGSYSCGGTGSWVIPQYFLQCQSTSFGFVQFTVTGGSFPNLTGSFDASTGSYSDTFSILPAGGGSVAYGSLITLANGVRVPVQNVRAGDTVLLVDVHTGHETKAMVNQIVATNVDTLLIIHTTYGEPLRIDANPLLWIHVQSSTGEIGWMRATEIVPGDRLYNVYSGGWVAVTQVSLASGGQHLMFDLSTTPFGDYLANGYADCPCKKGPGP